ncbi:MAG: DNA topoisomerase (ATP-hydrolyzing) subunit B [candidate division WOR-3 bacterium]
MTSPKQRYDASAIKVLKGLEGVRRRPAMYIGDVGKRGLHHLVYEIVDNSVDEALSGFCKNIEVIFRPDGAVTVSDDGRGIPVDTHPELGVSALEVVMTTLHAGGKFDHKAYAISGGLHGVGASVVNALSEWMIAEVRRDGKLWRQRYERGMKASEVEIVGDAEGTGTTITFKPDPEIFKERSFDFELAAERLRELAFLVAGVRIRVVDEGTGREEVFLYEGGLREFLGYLDEARETLFSPPFYAWFRDQETGVECECALEYTDAYSEIVLTYANTIGTHEGGTHLTGFRSALTRVINDYGKQSGLMKNGQAITGEDTREGLTAVLHVKLPDPQFEGQTKTKLGNGYIRGIVETGLYEKLWRFLEENPRAAQAIVAKCLLAAKGREAARKARELTRRKSFLESDSLPGKLTDCISREKDSAELFIVEGESAGGNAKQGRDRHTQAVLPLRGKILNVEKSTLDRSLSNAEIRTLVSAIGSGIGDDCDPSESRYGKIIIMTDADVDGAHIRTLLLTFFYRYMRPLVEEGYIYIAQPPLFRVQKGKTFAYAYDEEELWARGVQVAHGIKAFRKDGSELPDNELLSKLLIFYRFRKYSDVLVRYDQDLIRLVEPIVAGMGMWKKTFSDTDEMFKFINEIKGNKAIPEFTVNQEKLEVVFKVKSGNEIPVPAEDLRLLLNLYAEASEAHTRDGFKDMRFVLEKEEAVISKPDDLVYLLRRILSYDPASVVTIQRYKGLGEMNPDQLWETTMNPETRTLRRVSVEDAEQAERLFSILMGDQVEPRREFIERNALKAANIDI